MCDPSPSFRFSDLRVPKRFSFQIFRNSHTGFVFGELEDGRVCILNKDTGSQDLEIWIHDSEAKNRGWKKERVIAKCRQLEVNHLPVRGWDISFYVVSMNSRTQEVFIGGPDRDRSDWDVPIGGL